MDPYSDPTFLRVFYPYHKYLFFLHTHDFKSFKWLFRPNFFKENWSLVQISGENYQILTYLVIFVEVTVHFRNRIQDLACQIRIGPKKI
jgi:hypothetical protein